MHPILNIAVRAVRRAGNLIAKYYEIPYNVESFNEENNHFATKVHQGVKITIIKTIRQSYPYHTILSEEISKNENSSKKDIQWVIDPLDGIINFVKRLPHFAVSIAVRIKDRTEIAVVYDPIRNELFTAVRGQGAKLNGYRLRGSNTRDLNSAIIATGFPFKAKSYSKTYMNIFRKILTECADFRRTGSTSLDLAYVAANRVDGYFEISLKPWSFTAGELIVRESGAFVCDFIGGHDYIMTGNIIAGNLKVVRAILVNIRNN